MSPLRAEIRKVAHLAAPVVGATVGQEPSAVEVELPEFGPGGEVIGTPLTLKSRLLLGEWPRYLVSRGLRPGSLCCRHRRNAPGYAGIGTGAL